MYALSQLPTCLPPLLLPLLALLLPRSCQRYLFIKLTYHDHTPDDYEPPHFHGVTEETIGHFRRPPFSM